MTFKIRPKAEDDIVQIALFIASDNPRAARQWIDSVEEACRRIGDMPRSGTPRPEIALGLRTVRLGKYLILYNEADDHADIVRVVHGARDTANWL